MYKNNSQHRGSKHWQYLLQVCGSLACLHAVPCLPHLGQPLLLQLQVQRQLRLLDGLNLAQLFDHLGKAARGSTVPVSSAASLVRFSRCVFSLMLPKTQLLQRVQLATSQYNTSACSRGTFPACRPATLNVPQVDSVALVMRRLLAACTVVLELHQAVQKAASQLSAQLALTYFMPLSLTALAMLARTRVSLLHLWPVENCCHVIAAARKQDSDCHATLHGHLGTSNTATCLTAKDLPLHAGADRSDAAGCLQGIQCPGHSGCCPASWTVQQPTHRQGCCMLLLL